MGRPRNGCGRCGGPQRHPVIVGQCSECHEMLCQKHIRWDAKENRWVCTKCLRGKPRGQ